MSIQLYTNILRGVIGLVILCFFAPLQNIAVAQEYNVEINKTKIMHLPAPAAAIIVGNPEIADISVHSPTLLFVLGRGYGVTNVIILDDIGNTILETDIQVGGNLSGSGKRLMMVGRGWQSYDCTPFCQPAPVLGNDPKFLADFKGQTQTIDNTGAPITTTPISGSNFNTGTLDTSFPDGPAPFANATGQPIKQMQTPQTQTRTASNFASRRGAVH